MTARLLVTRVTPQGLVPLRMRARQIGELFGLDTTQRTRFVTALSELARNAVQYADGGSVTFLLETLPDLTTQRLVAQVADHGPGIDDLPAILAGRLNASQRVPMGIAGSMRLVDELSFETPAGGGTVATIRMALPRHAPHLGPPDIAARIEQIARRRPQTPLDELEQQNRDMLDTLQQLEAKQSELEQADAHKNEFLAMLAHELRNPLGTLHLTLELMRRTKDPSPDQIAQQIDVMARQTAQLGRLVADLMDVSRINRGKVEFHKQAIDLRALVGEAIEMTQASILAKAHRVVHTPCRTSLPVCVDVARMKQVLCNLIDNAARYTRHGGVIRIGVRQEGAHGVVDVSDNGVGIAPELLSRVFDIFVQGDRSEHDGATGLGVGLTLVRRLVEEHGGAVFAESAGLGSGSCFTVTLPLVAAAP